jgi:ankyrin repeat protein
VCAGLITIDRESKVIHLVHQTVQEYLQHIQNDLFPAAQEYIAQTCFIYLLFDAFAIHGEMSNESIRTLTSKYPLFPYAAQNWGYHAFQSPEQNVGDLILNFLEQAPKLAYFVMHSLTYQYGASGRRTVADAPKLQIAASLGLKETMNALLEGGADIEARSSDGWTALSSAAWNGQEDVIELLLKHGADIEAKNDAGWTALALACRNEHLGAVQKLLTKGADIETRNYKRWTPLLSAAWHGHEAVIRLLLDNGADIEAKNEAGWTPLHQVTGHGDADLTRLLLENGANIHATSRWRWTPLMSAVTAKTSDEHIVQLLLQAGSDVSARDTRGETAYTKALQHRKTAILHLLR